MCTNEHHIFNREKGELHFHWHGMYISMRPTKRLQNWSIFTFSELSSLLEVTLVWMCCTSSSKSIPNHTLLQQRAAMSSIACTSVRPQQLHVVKKRSFTDSEQFYSFVCQSTCIHVVKRCDNVLMHIHVVMMYKCWEDVHTWTRNICNYSTCIFQWNRATGF